MTRAYNTATTQQNSGGPVSSVTAGKNFIINGGMDIWQRGTSFASPSAAYTADRICATPTAGGTTWSVSQVASFLTGSRYALRVQRASGQTGTPALYLGGALETNDVIRLQGQTVTWSFYAKAGSNFSPSASGVAVQFNTGTGTDQGPFVGHTGEVTQVNTSATLSTTATRYTYTFIVPTNATSMRWNIAMTPSGTAGTNDFYDITNMQLEVGSVATTFSRAGGTIQGELAACQRYYWRANSAGGVYTIFSFGYTDNTTTALITTPVPSYMRVFPTSVDYANLAFQEAQGGIFTFAAIALNGGSGATAPNNNIQMQITGASGMTIGRPGRLLSNGVTNGHLGFSAEL